MANSLTLMFTSAGGEKQLMEQTLGFTSQGPAFYTPNISSATTVFRLNRGPHRLYTVSASEKDAAKAIYGFNEESRNFSAKTSPDTDAVPVYRISAPDRHFYTTSRTERDNAVMYYGYMSEGTEFYGIDSGTPGAKTLHRLTDRFGNRVFTPDSTERDNAVSIYGYTSEGTGWYGL
jgi:hypothetical protein